MDATHKNILAIKEHSEITRKELRDMQEILAGYGNTLDTFGKYIEQLKAQIHSIQVRLFSGGPTA